MNIVYKDDIILAQKQLHALTIIDINQKLSIYDNKLSIDETNEYLQPVVRFFLNQNRHSIYLFLENVLGKYINDIVAFKRCNFVTSYEIESRKEVTIAVNLFLNQSKMGFLKIKSYQLKLKQEQVLTFLKLMSIQNQILLLKYCLV